MASETQFKGLYYVGQEKYSIHFSVSAQGSIEFEYDKSKSLGILLHKTTLDLIGDPETTLQISWTDSIAKHTLLSHDPALLARLLKINLFPATRERIAALQTKQQKQFKREKHRVPLYLTVIAAFFFGTYFMFTHAVPFIADLIPYQWEKEIGSFAFENYQAGKRKVEAPLVNNAVKSIIQRIDQFDDAEMTYQVVIIDAEMVNAFAFPGGFVVITSGLISNAEKPEEVAGVLAHELTHVLQRHSMRKLVRQAGLGVLIGIVLGDVSALSQLMELSSHLDTLSFDRSQERHADEGAIKIMQAAGISPQHLVSFFKKIKQLDSVAGDIPEIFRTHPLTDDRIERVATAKEPKELFTFDLDWSKVKQAL